jgi:hypothetical protein
MRTSDHSGAACCLRSRGQARSGADQLAREIADFAGSAQCEQPRDLLVFWYKSVQNSVTGNLLPVGSVAIGPMCRWGEHLIASGVRMI